jgi:hypothetical protein
LFNLSSYFTAPGSEFQLITGELKETTAGTASITGAVVIRKSRTADHAE